MTALERRYRAVLRTLLPSALRGERVDELVATLLDQAGPARRWPSPLEVMDLCGYALRTRVRLLVSGSRTPLWGEGLGWAGAVSVLVLAAIGAVVVGRWCGEVVALTPASGTRLVAGTSVLSVAGAAAAALWPAVCLAVAGRRRRLAQILVLLAAAGGAVVIAANATAGRGRPALDLCGGLGAFAVTAVIALRSASPQAAGVLDRLPRAAWISAFVLLTGLVGAATARGTLGAPGPWIGAGPAVGLRTSLLTGLLVAGWVLVSAVALIRRSPRLLVAVAILSLAPALGAAGYVLNSSAAHSRPIVDLLAARAPVVAAGAAVVLFVVGRAGAIATQTARA